MTPFAGVESSVGLSLHRDSRKICEGQELLTIASIVCFDKQMTSSGFPERCNGAIVGLESFLYPKRRQF